MPGSLQMAANASSPLRGVILPPVGTPGSPAGGTPATTLRADGRTTGHGRVTVRQQERLDNGFKGGFAGIDPCHKRFMIPSSFLISRRNAAQSQSRMAATWWRHPGSGGGANFFL
jgi:hypothetical protein